MLFYNILIIYSSFYSWSFLVRTFGWTFWYFLRGWSSSTYYPTFHVFVPEESRYPFHSHIRRSILTSQTSFIHHYFTSYHTSLITYDHTHLLLIIYILINIFLINIFSFNIILINIILIKTNLIILILFKLFLIKYILIKSIPYLILLINYILFIY